MTRRRRYALGQPVSVHFEWLLDTVHGADYSRRWHRDKRNSAGCVKAR
jgi:predicted dehydrogenase